MIIDGLMEVYFPILPYSRQHTEVEQQVNGKAVEDGLDVARRKRETIRLTLDQSLNAEMAENARTSLRMRNMSQFQQQ